MSTFTPIFFLSKLHPDRIHQLHVVVILECAIVWIGGFWMLVQVIDHEERPRACVAFSIIPFMFLWYRPVRYPARPKFIRYRPPSSDRTA
jgi:hypothetical protein